MVFVHISKKRERSYWECEWNFPPTGSTVVITLVGDEFGPRSEWRRFYLDLPNRCHAIRVACRPVLEKIYQGELHQSPPAAIFAALKTTGFGVKDPDEKPVHWNVSFENTGDEFVAISIPFEGETAMAPDVEIC
jgi:hypothetical protein